MKRCQSWLCYTLILICVDLHTKTALNSFEFSQRRQHNSTPAVILQSHAGDPQAEEGDMTFHTTARDMIMYGSGSAFYNILRLISSALRGWGAPGPHVVSSVWRHFQFQFFFEFPKTSYPVLPPRSQSLSYNNDPPFNLCVLYSERQNVQRGGAVCLKAIHAGNFLNKKYCQPANFSVNIRTRFKSFLSWLSIVIFCLFLSDFVWSNSWMKGIVGPSGNYACWFSL